MSKPKIAFVIGHTLFKKGAYSKILGFSEFDFWWQYKEDLEELGDVYRHNPLIPSYKVRQRIMAKKTKDYDLVFELHFNMFNGNAKGAEACCYNSISSINLNREFINKYCSLTGSNNRGVKILKPNSRGYWFVKSQKPPAILYEGFFGDNKEDVGTFSIKAFKESVKHVSNKL